jgi:hypothetical protein
MALDYLSIPGTFLSIHHIFYHVEFIAATSVDVERVFSKGQLLLSHVRN